MLVSSRSARAQFSLSEPPVPDFQISYARMAIWSWLGAGFFIAANGAGVATTAAAFGGTAVLRTGVLETTSAAGATAFAIVFAGTDVFFAVVLRTAITVLLHG